MQGSCYWAVVFRERWLDMLVMNTDSIGSLPRVESQFYHYELCDIGQDTIPLWALLFSSVKQGEYLYLLHVVTVRLK